MAQIAVELHDSDGIREIRSCTHSLYNSSKYKIVLLNKKGLSSLCIRCKLYAVNVIFLDYCFFWPRPDAANPRSEATSKDSGSRSKTICAGRRTQAVHAGAGAPGGDQYARGVPALSRPRGDPGCAGATVSPERLRGAAAVPFAGGDGARDAGAGAEEPADIRALLHPADQENSRGAAEFRVHQETVRGVAGRFTGRLLRAGSCAVRRGTRHGDVADLRSRKAEERGENARGFRHCGAITGAQRRGFALTKRVATAISAPFIPPTRRPLLPLRAARQDGFLHV